MTEREKVRELIARTADASLSYAAKARLDLIDMFDAMEAKALASSPAGGLVEALDDYIASGNCNDMWMPVVDVLDRHHRAALSHRAGEPGDENRKCEGCGVHATKEDSEGVPLCGKCHASLVAEQSRVPCPTCGGCREALLAALRAMNDEGPGAGLRVILTEGLGALEATRPRCPTCGGTRDELRCPCTNPDDDEPADCEKCVCPCHVRKGPLCAYCIPKTNPKPKPSPDERKPGERTCPTCKGFATLRPCPDPFHAETP